METATSSSANGNEAIAANKKTVERSASYPSCTIAESIELVTKIYKNFTGAATVTREDVAAILDEPGNVNREVASAVQYGLLVREAGFYKISPLFLPLYQPVPGSNERGDALISAFKSPKLYKDLIAKYDNHAIPSIDALAIVLFRQHEITEKASKQAAEIFLANGKFVGAISSIGILKTTAPSTPNPESVETIQEVFASNEPVANNNPEVKILEQNNVQTKILNLPEGSTEEKIVIPLTEKKKAVLIYPSNFNAKDIAVLKSQLDVLALLLE